MSSRLRLVFRLTFQKFGNHEKVDLFSDTKLTSQRFVEKYMALESEASVPEDQVMTMMS